MGQGVDLRGEALRRFGETRRRDAMHRAEGGDDVRRFKIVVDRRGDEIEELRRHLRVLDMEREGGRVREPLYGKGDGHASPADGDDEPWPGRFERLVGGDGTKEASRRHMDLQPRRKKPHGAGHAHAFQAKGQADRLGHGDALGLHADRAVGDDPGLRSSRLPAGGNERRGVLRRRALGLGPGGRGSWPAKISGTNNAQFLFDSFGWRT